MDDIVWKLAMNLFIFPVLGGLCGAVVAQAIDYDSKLHKVLGVLGIIAILILILVLNFGK